MILTLVNAAASLQQRASGSAPIRGAAATLEWFAPSPPPVHNFDLVPDVRSAEPLADIREAIRRRQTRWTPPPRRRPRPRARARSRCGAAEAEQDPDPIAAEREADAAAPERTEDPAAEADAPEDTHPKADDDRPGA